MSEAWTEDVADLWTQYQSQKAIVTALQTALIALTNGNEPDYTAINKSEDGGSQSWSMETLTARLKAARAEMKEMRELAVKASPGFQVRRLARNCNPGGW
jgi:hypothetical protein